MLMAAVQARSFSARRTALQALRRRRRRLRLRRGGVDGMRLRRRRRGGRRHEAAAAAAGWTRAVCKHAVMSLALSSVFARIDRDEPMAKLVRQNSSCVGRVCLVGALLASRRQSTRAAAPSASSSAPLFSSWALRHGDARAGRCSRAAETPAVCGRSTWSAVVYVAIIDYRQW